MSATKTNQIVETYKAHYLHRYHLEGVDLEKELELIKQKKSNLSRSQRDAVVASFQIFPVLLNNVKTQNETENTQIEKPLTEEATDIVSDEQKDVTPAE